MTEELSKAERAALAALALNQYLDEIKEQLPYLPRYAPGLSRKLSLFQDSMKGIYGE